MKVITSLSLINPLNNMGGEGDTTTTTQEGLTTPEGGQETVADALERLGISDSKKETDIEAAKPKVEVKTNTETKTAPKPGSLAAVAESKERWKKTAQAYTTLFPDADDAKAASEILNAFAGDEFKSDNFINTLEGISKKRATELKTAIKAQVAQEARKDVIKNLFGREDVTPEEIKTVQAVLENGGLMKIFGDPKDSDIPDKLKLDESGNERSEEEINFFRDLKKLVTTAVKNTEKINERFQTDDQKATDNAKRVLVEEFSADRIAGLDSVIEDLKLDDETANDFVGLTMHYFGNDKDAKTLWQDAVKAKIDGENLLARRLAKKVDLKFAEYAKKAAKRFSAEALAEFNKANEKVKAATDGREEISEGGETVHASGASAVKLDPNDPFDTSTAMKQYDELIASGRIGKR